MTLHLYPAAEKMIRELQAMGDEHDAAEAAWYEQGCPSLEELARREGILPKDVPWLTDHAIDATKYALRIGERVFERHFPNVRPFGTRCTHCGMSLAHRIHQATKQNSIQEDSVTKKDDLLARERATRASLERLQDKIAKLERFPDEDPFQDGDVISFTKRFGDGKVQYLYAGVRVKGQYYLTSSSTYEGDYRLGWNQLIEFMTNGGDVDGLWLMNRHVNVLDEVYSSGDSSAATPE